MSSFPLRLENNVTWYVDGEDYFAAVCDALLQAKSEVFISDWWLSPEMYLKRPCDAEENRETQVVEILGQIADRGVMVNVHVYKEVSLALTLNSMHTKMALVKRNPNIIVVRHPSRSAVGGSFLWSHHEKIVCID
jgi:phosphatidylserine/phosphatidylglycerophosphate/cardiolipin synthase-like enzyme